MLLEASTVENMKKAVKHTLALSATCATVLGASIFANTPVNATLVTDYYSIAQPLGSATGSGETRRVDVSHTWVKAHENGQLDLVSKIPQGRANVTQGQYNEYNVLLSSANGTQEYKATFSADMQTGKVITNSTVQHRTKTSNTWSGVTNICKNTNQVKYTWAAGKDTIGVQIPKECLPGSNGTYYVANVTVVHKNLNKTAQDVSWIKRNTVVPGTSSHVTPTPQVEPQKKILLIGDSVTQGQTGDVTVRYRLWQHLSENRVNFDFVGPYNGLRAKNADGSNNYTNQNYKNSNFDRDHAARWGQLLKNTNVAGLVNTYQPDAVVIALGVNDLINGATPAQVENIMSTKIREIQALKQNVNIIIAPPSQNWINGVKEYNTRLSNLAKTHTTTTTPITIATSPAQYNASTHTYDNLHPNMSGESLIAWELANAFYKISWMKSPKVDVPKPTLASPKKDVVTINAKPGVTPTAYYAFSQPVKNCSTAPVESKWVRSSHKLTTPAHTIGSTSPAIWVRLHGYREATNTAGAPTCINVK